MLKTKRRTDEELRRQKKKTMQKKKRRRRRRRWRARKEVFHVRDSPRESRDSKKRRPAEKRLDSSLRPAANEGTGSPLSFLLHSFASLSIRLSVSPLSFSYSLLSSREGRPRARGGPTAVPFNAPTPHFRDIDASIIRPSKRERERKSRDNDAKLTRETGDKHVPNMRVNLSRSADIAESDSSAETRGLFLLISYADISAHLLSKTSS